MNLYNMLHGATSATFFVMPMLGDKHPDNYPRFRDCFIKDEEYPEYDNYIHVYTRVGGGNRGQGYGEDLLCQHPEYVTNFDDSFDSTYATYIFKVPEKWKADFELVVAGELDKLSKEYQAQVRKVFPKLKDKLDQLWGHE